MWSAIDLRGFRRVVFSNGIVSVREWCRNFGMLEVREIFWDDEPLPLPLLAPLPFWNPFMVIWA